MCLPGATLVTVGPMMPLRVAPCGVLTVDTGTMPLGRRPVTQVRDGRGREGTLQMVGEGVGEVGPGKTLRHQFRTGMTDESQ